MAIWDSKSLGEIVTLQRGYDLPAAERIEGNIPIYGSAGITGYHHIAKKQGPGVVVGRSGASIGKVNYIPTDYWPHNAVLFVTDFKGNAPMYVYYLLSTLDLGSLNSGSAQPSLNRNYVYTLEALTPPLPTQKKIASILSAYDDLIENNNRRIKILEEMAQNIYREWFVHFRYPGHEDVPMVDSELGQIPQGWEVKKVADFGDVLTGKTPSKKVPEYFGANIPFIKPPDMSNGMFCLATEDGLSAKGAASQPKKTIPPNSLCVSCIGTPGLVVITHKESQTNQQINSIVLPDIIQREYLYFALLALKPTIDQYAATGATMPNLSKGKFENLHLIYPELQVITDFHMVTEPIFEEIRTVQVQNQNLRKTRDLLLPKLISGQLDVEELDIKV